MKAQQNPLNHNDTKVNLLLVDDRPENIQVLEASLEDLGHNMMSATSCRNALKLLSEREFAVIIIGVNMPVLDGYETAELVRQHPNHLDTPIIFITENINEDEHFERVYTIGSVDFVFKPINWEILKGKVKWFVDLVTKSEVEKQHAYVKSNAELETLNRELQASESRLRAIISQNADAMVIVDHNGVTCFANPAAGRLFDRSNEELIDAQFGFPVVGADITELDILNRSGSIISAEMRVANIEWEGQPAYLASLRDITEHKRAEDALRVNEERMRLTVQNLPVMVDASDENGNLELWNQECERVTGYSAEEIIGNPQAWDMLVPDREYRERIIRELHKRGRDYLSWEWELTAKDGSKKIISWSYISDRFPIPGWTSWGIGIDVTEVVEYRENLEHLVKERTTEIEKARKKIDTILNSVGDGLIVFDTKNQVILMNPAAEKLMGVQLHEVLGKPLNVDVVINGVATLTERIQTALEKNQTEYEFDFEMPTADPKESRIFHAKTSTIMDENGAKTGVVVIIRDVTIERKIDHEKSAFVSIVSHELRSPMTTILGFSELLLNRTRFTEQQQAEYIYLIHKDAKRLAGLTTELLDISRIESGEGLAFSKTICHPQDCFVSDIESYQLVFPTHHFELILISGGVELFVDKGKMIQVFKNIISNAIKYSPDGGLIHVTGMVKDGNYVVSVEDQGIGMTPAQVARIFEKFYRADPSNTAIEGTGLGMTLTKHLVEMHDGQIWVESEFGKGTTVKFSIPIIPDNFSHNGHTD
ncbi:MAG: PAS domain S-box protein [Candidatus Electryoneaceae bacterium]|nr:PAS domain S-box protein [Candidatus Electryoneaceae bacterium]